MSFCPRYARYTVPLVALLALFVLTGAVCADSGVLTVSQAVELAKGNSTALQIAQLELAISKITYEKAMVNSQTPLQHSGAEIAWAKAQAAYQQSETDLIVNVLESYVNLQSAAVDVEVKAKSAAQSAQELERTKLLVAKGSASPIEQLQAEMNAMSAANAAEAATSSYQSMMADFQRLLGIESAPNLLTAPFLKAPECTISLDEAITAALAASSSVADLRNALETAKLNRELDLAGGLSPLDDQVSQNNLLLAELRLANAEASVRASVTNQYNALLQAAKGLKVAESSLAIARQQFDISKKQVEAGIKTGGNLIDAEIALMKAETAYQNTLGPGSGYIGRWISFQRVLGLPLNLSEVLTDAAL